MKPPVSLCAETVPEVVSVSPELLVGVEPEVDRFPVYQTNSAPLAFSKSHESGVELPTHVTAAIEAPVSRRS